jgi:hypothetical protein
MRSAEGRHAGPVCAALLGGFTLFLGATGSSETSARGEFEPADHFDQAQLARLRDGRSAVATATGPANELAVTVAGRIAITPERLLSWGRQIELVHATTLVAGSGRFSDPPQLEDLAELQLSEDDLRDLKNCRPRDCGVKLSASEIAVVREAVASAPANWKPAASAAFKQILLERASSYTASGFSGAEPFEDHRKPVLPLRELEAISRGPERRTAFRAAAIAECLEPDAGPPPSYLYWSKNAAEGAREVITITQLSIQRCGPGSVPVLISTQLYATHYLDASVSYTTLASSGAQQYLLYLRRVRIDLLHGFWGPLVRSILQNEIRKNAPALLDQIRKRLESGEPASVTPPISGRR